MESRKVMVCQTCGSTGFSDALVKCTICNTAAEHLYCLEKKLIADELTHWICRECKPKPPKPEVKQCTKMTKLVHEMKQISPTKNSRATKISNQKMSAEPQFVSPQKSLNFSSYQPHPLGDKSTCLYANGYSICRDDLGDSSSERIENCLHSPRIEKSKFEATFLEENGGTSAESSWKSSDCEKFVRSRRRMLLPEEDQRDQICGVNIIGDESQRTISKEKILFQATDYTSTDEQGKQIFVQKKRTFAWFEKEYEPTITAKNGQEALHTNENLLFQVVNHASAIEENGPGTDPDKFQAVYTWDRTEQVSLRQKRKLTRSYEDRSNEVHANIIDQDASRERLFADQSVSAVIHHGSMFQIDTPAVTCDRFRTASLQRNHEHVGAPAQPIMHHIWRGCFDVCGQKYGPLVAHLSSKACERVWNTTRVLPPVLQMVKLPQCKAWPKSFETLPPTDDNIALYFFAQDDRIEVAVKELLGDVMKNDLMLKIVLDETELLVFSSIILPDNTHRFQGKYYLWGAFRRKETGVTNVVMTSPSVENPWLKPPKELKELDIPKRSQRIGTLHEQGCDMKVASSKAKCRNMRANVKARVEYQVGDLVLVKFPCRRDNDSTFRIQRNRHYEGPFRIVKKVGKMAYKLKIPQTLQQRPFFHANLLKLYHGNKGNSNRLDLTDRHHRPWKLLSSKNHEDFNRGRN